MAGGNQQNDLYNIPNVIIRYVDSPDQETLRAEYINDDNSSPLSIGRRGRRIVDVEAVDDIADQDTLLSLIHICQGWNNLCPWLEFCWTSGERVRRGSGKIN